MRIRLVALAVVSAAFTSPKPAAAMPSEAFLANSAGMAPGLADGVAFHAYLRGAMEMMVPYTKALEFADGGVMNCVPSGRHFDLDDLRAMVSQAIETCQDDAGKPLPQFAIASFAEIYPCS